LAEVSSSLLPWQRADAVAAMIVMMMNYRNDGGDKTLRDFWHPEAAFFFGPGGRGESMKAG